MKLFMRMKQLGVLGLVVLSLGQAMAGAPICPQRGGGGGGDIPFPFETANQKAELADGEVYILSGRVVFAPGPVSVEPAAYLEVDFKEHPWLESAKRKQVPFYLLENSEVDWKKWENQRVIVPVRAKGQILTNPHSDPVYTLTLKAIAEPVAPPPVQQRP